MTYLYHINMRMELETIFQLSNISEVLDKSQFDKLHNLQKFKGRTF